MVMVAFVKSDNTIHTYLAKDLRQANADVKILTQFGHKATIINDPRSV